MARGGGGGGSEPPGGDVPCKMQCWAYTALGFSLTLNINNSQDTIYKIMVRETELTIRTEHRSNNVVMIKLFITSLI